MNHQNHQNHQNRHCLKNQNLKLIPNINLSKKSDPEKSSEEKIDVNIDASKRMRLKILC